MKRRTLEQKTKETKIKGESFSGDNSSYARKHRPGHLSKGIYGINSPFNEERRKPLEICEHGGKTTIIEPVDGSDPYKVCLDCNHRIEEAINE